jgi:hypothetical protein
MFIWQQQQGVYSHVEMFEWIPPHRNIRTSQQRGPVGDFNSLLKNLITKDYKNVVNEELINPVKIWELGL